MSVTCVALSNESDNWLFRLRISSWALSRVVLYH
jgi:hypothetical protein